MSGTARASVEHSRNTPRNYLRSIPGVPATSCRPQVKKIYEKTSKLPKILTKSSFWVILGAFLMAISRKSEHVRDVIRGCQTSYMTPRICQLVFMVVHHPNIMEKIQLGHRNAEKSANSSITFFCDVKF